MMCMVALAVSQYIWTQLMSYRENAVTSIQHELIIILLSLNTKHYKSPSIQHFYILTASAISGVLSIIIPLWITQQSCVKKVEHPSQDTAII